MPDGSNNRMATEAAHMSRCTENLPRHSRGGADPRRRSLSACGTWIALLAASVAALPADVIRSERAVPAHIAGRFRNPTGFQQDASGQYFVFDRRSHTVFGLDERQESVWPIVDIGAEEGRILTPTAFSVEPAGTFVVADAPRNQERIQIFTRAGFRINGFLLSARRKPRVVVDSVIVSGIASLQYTGSSILISQPESGALITEYALTGQIKRTFGRLRRTDHESDPEIHVALNTGIPLVDPTGGFFFVFQTGRPLLHKYDEDGRLVFERVIQGRELDAFVSQLPDTWSRPKTADGELPLVAPTVRSAAVDSAGNLWVAFMVPYTYVFNPDGDKIRTLQFRGAGIMTPNSMFFGTKGQLLVSPGLYEFRP